MRQTETAEVHLTSTGRSPERPVFFPDVLLYRGRSGDGEECLVTFDRSTVVLSRAVGGLACRIRLSVSQYQAVALLAGENRHVIRLMHEDDSLSIDLTSLEDLDTAEEYRDRLANFLNLPCVTMGAGAPSAYPNATVLVGGRTHLMKRRRARFLTRRRSGEVIDIRPLEAREIIARN